MGINVGVCKIARGNTLGENIRVQIGCLFRNNQLIHLISCGVQIHPRRMPGATIFEKDPIRRVWSGRYFLKGGYDLSENRSSPYASSSTKMVLGPARMSAHVFRRFSEYVIPEGFWELGMP